MRVGYVEQIHFVKSECLLFPQNGEDTLNIYIFQETKSSPKIKRFWTTLFAVIYAHAGNSSG